MSDRPAVVCRQIGNGDLDQVVELLTRAFRAQRNRAFWTRAVGRLAEREPPVGLPRFGYLLDSGGSVVGVLLVIASEIPDGCGVRLWCNVSSWYVEPAFRAYGMLLERHARRHRGATYLNVTPAPHTRRGLAAQGYTPFVTGRVLGLPALACSGSDARVRLVDDALEPGGGLTAAEAELLRTHAGWGCLSVVCEADGERLPFVFGPRRRFGFVPFAYVLYCRDIDSFVRHARALGRFLAQRGILPVVIDSDGPVPGIAGRFRAGHRSYFLGPDRPRIGNLAYTERAIFGV